MFSLTQIVDRTEKAVNMGITLLSMQVIVVVIQCFNTADQVRCICRNILGRLNELPFGHGIAGPAGCGPT